MTKELVYLVQTDTTAGFLSKSDEKLAHLKQRSKDQKTLQTLDSFTTLKYNTRIPNKFKRFVRRSNKTTFIYPNKKAFRVIDPNDKHHKFIQKFSTMYSTSANKTKEKFNLDFALNNADITVEDKYNFRCTESSQIVLLSTQKMCCIR
ncbi:MAG: Sua5 YciO YrdC YwlC family protein, partial [Campylobacterota bacterium]|nr:Sua5 YciO YrdC YwlC family protein [Campylobacterota bacterium]